MRAHTRRLVALAVALCALGACAVAYAHPLHIPAWHDLLGQTTGGSFGGSSWGSGGGSSSSGGGSSSSSGSGGGFVEAIVGLLFELVLQLLWQAFVWCLTEYPAPTVAVIVTVALFAWGARAPVGSTRGPSTDEGVAPRGAELGPDDEALLRDLARTTTLVGRAGFGFSAALGVAALLAATRRDAHAGTLLAALFEVAAGVVAAAASWRVLRASASLQKVGDTTGEDLDHLSAAVDHLRQLFEWTGGALALLLAALAVLVVVLFSLGA